MKQKAIILLIFNVLIGATLFGQSQFSLTINVKGFKSQKGTIKLQVQNEQQQDVFKKIDALSGSSYQLTIPNLPEGRYAVNVIHDKNNNNKLDTNLLGIPTEGWGCSNNARGFMGAPSFLAKLFSLKANKTITINLVHY